MELLKSTPGILRELSAKEVGISLRAQERWISDYLENGLDKFIQAQVNSKKIKGNHT